jgi:hypothetical protein
VQDLNITYIGAAARLLLAPGQSGQVLAALSNVIYLQTASGEVLWAACGDAAMHRRCLRVSTPPPRPAAGTPFHVEGHRLEMDSGVVLDSADATLWQAPLVNNSRLVESSEIPGRVRAIAAGLDLSQARGLALLIPRLVHCGPDLTAAMRDRVTRQARPLVLDMADACRSRDRRRIVRGAEALIGLGGGLTPSGDDFLGGLLFAMSALALYPALALPDMSIIVEPYRSRTNPISFTLLDDLAKGHAIEPLHRVANGILESDPPDNLHLAIRQLTDVGHSTGWDMLTGLFSGLQATELTG